MKEGSVRIHRERIPQRKRLLHVHVPQPRYHESPGDLHLPGTARGAPSRARHHRRHSSPLHHHHVVRQVRAIRHVDNGGAHERDDGSRHCRRRCDAARRAARRSLPVRRTSDHALGDDQQRRTTAAAGRRGQGESVLDCSAATFGAMRVVATGGRCSPCNHRSCCRVRRCRVSRPLLWARVRMRVPGAPTNSTLRDASLASFITRRRWIHGWVNRSASESIAPWAHRSPRCGTPCRRSSESPDSRRVSPGSMKVTRPRSTTDRGATSRHPSQFRRLRGTSGQLRRASPARRSRSPDSPSSPFLMLRATSAPRLPVRCISRRISSSPATGS